MVETGWYKLIHYRLLDSNYYGLKYTVSVPCGLEKYYCETFQQNHVKRAELRPKGE